MCVLLTALSQNVRNIGRYMKPSINKPTKFNGYETTIQSQIGKDFNPGSI